MATYHAIAAVGEALRRLLDDSCPRAEFPAAQIRIIRADDFQSPPFKEGVSLFLYRVAINATQRNRAARTSLNGRRFRPALPLDLYYLLTPWAESADKQHRLLGWAMRAVEDMCILPAGLLNAAGPEEEVFQPSETVELICESLSLQDETNVWQGLRAAWQMSATYVARLVALDSMVELTAAPLVQAQEFQLGKGPPP